MPWKSRSASSRRKRGVTLRPMPLIIDFSLHKGPIDFHQPFAWIELSRKLWLQEALSRYGVTNRCYLPQNLPEQQRDKPSCP